MEKHLDNAKIGEYFDLAMNKGSMFCPSDFLTHCKSIIKDFKEFLEYGYFDSARILQENFNVYAMHNPHSDFRIDLLRWLIHSLEGLFTDIPKEDRPATLYACSVCIWKFFDVSSFWKAVPLSPATVNKLSPIMFAYLKVVKFSLHEAQRIPINEQELFQQYNDAVARKDHVVLEHLYPRFSLVSERMVYTPQQLALSTAKHFLINKDVSTLIGFVNTFECGLYLRDFLSEITIKQRIELCVHTENRDFTFQALFGDRLPDDYASQAGEDIPRIASCLEKLTFDSHYSKQVVRQITNRIAGQNHRDTLYAFGVYLTTAEAEVCNIFIDSISIQVMNISSMQYHREGYMYIAAGYANSKIIKHDDVFLNAIVKKWKNFLTECAQDDELSLIEECRTNIDAFIRILYHVDPSRSEVEMNFELENIRKLHIALCELWFKSKMHYMVYSYISLYKYTVFLQVTNARAQGIHPLEYDIPLLKMNPNRDAKKLYDGIKKSI